MAKQQRITPGRGKISACWPLYGKITPVITKVLSFWPLKSPHFGYFTVDYARERKFYKIVYHTVRFHEIEVKTRRFGHYMERLRQGEKENLQVLAVMR